MRKKINRLLGEGKKKKSIIVGIWKISPSIYLTIDNDLKVSVNFCVYFNTRYSPFGKNENSSNNAKNEKIFL